MDRERGPDLVRSRRRFLSTSVGIALASTLGVRAAPQVRELRIAPFSLDVTPPIGHPLCGGWIPAARVVEDALEAHGFVLLGAGEPIVVCALDWTGLLNDAHIAMRRAVARALGTGPERVAIHCVHQHDAPFACPGAEAIATDGTGPTLVDVEFLEKTIERVARAASEASGRARRVTHVASSRARVERVASNRRVLGEDGRVAFWRGSSTRDEHLRALPEGIIDPWLRTVAFFEGDEKIVSCHYYATHPMSHYGQGHVSSDFIGLARKAMARAEPATAHVSFTGAAGDVAAGKYNDGAPETRAALSARVLDALLRAEAELRPVKCVGAGWRYDEILPAGNPRFDEEALLEVIRASSPGTAARNRNAFALSWLRRARSEGPPIIVSALTLRTEPRSGESDRIALLHLPAECFVEYQLLAQAIAPRSFVATAAYGDGGPWYLPTERAHAQGGYEVSVAFAEPGVDRSLVRSIGRVLGG